MRPKSDDAIWRHWLVKGKGLNRPAQASEDFHGGENDVYKTSRYANRPARASEDFHGGENDVYNPSRHLNWPARASEDFHGGENDV